MTMIWWLFLELPQRYFMLCCMEKLSIARNAASSSPMSGSVGSIPFWKMMRGMPFLLLNRASTCTTKI